MNLKDLLNEAAEWTERAYAPYSRFRVACALETKDGRIFHGVNVENRSFGLTNCAERTALYTALTEGFCEFTSIAVYAPDGDAPTSPCGACRQVLSEFAGPGLKVIYGNTRENYIETTLGKLLPQDGLQELKERESK